MGVQPTTPCWYNDPAGEASHQAYWNGEQWTGATRPGPKTPAWKIIALATGLVVVTSVLPLWFLWWSFPTYGEYAIGVIAGLIIVGVLVLVITAFGWWAMGPVRRPRDPDRRGGT
jgi:hypothetical protein